MKRIGIVGVGSLGGFLANHLSYISYVHELVVIDPDIVESENVTKSIYDPADIGHPKVDAIGRKLRSSVKVIKINDSYSEGLTKLPKCNLLVDCRDVICSRHGEIDAKIYISERNLIIDCKKIVSYCREYPGSYIMQLQKDKINDAAFLARTMIVNGMIYELIKNNTVLRINLEGITSNVEQDLQTIIKNQQLQEDLIYDPDPGVERLREIESHINPIITLNKTRDLPIFVGERNPWKEYTEIEGSPVVKYDLAKAGELKSPADVIGKLARIAQRQGGHTTFIVTINVSKGDPRVELIQETGSA